MATSVFKSLAQDHSVLAGTALAVDQTIKSGKVLYHSTFESGFDGWRDHYEFKTPALPISLSSYPTFAGGRSLKLSTADRPNRAGFSQGCSTYKNLSRYWPSDKPVTVHIGGWFTHASGRKAPAWGSWGIGIDTQLWDNSDRRFAKLVCVHQASGGFLWQITGPTGALVSIPGSANLVSGENENKYNWDYVRLTVTMSEGRVMDYKEAQINNKVFDLRTLVASPQSQHPQAGDLGTSEGQYASFAGGFNPGIMLSPSTINPDAHPAMLFADEQFCVIEES